MSPVVTGVRHSEETERMDQPVLEIKGFSVCVKGEKECGLVITCKRKHTWPGHTCNSGNPKEFKRGNRSLFDSRFNAMGRQPY